MTENVVSAERYRPEGADALVRLRHDQGLPRGDARVVALAGVDLDVMRASSSPSSVPSGAGKSTILNTEVRRAGPGVGRDRRGGRTRSPGSSRIRSSQVPRRTHPSSGKVRHATSCRTSRCRRTSGCPPPCAGRRWRRSTTSTGCSSWSGSTTGQAHPGMSSGRRAAAVAIAAALSNTPSILLADSQADGGTGFRVRGSGPRRSAP